MQKCHWRLSDSCNEDSGGNEEDGGHNVRAERSLFTKEYCKPLTKAATEMLIISLQNESLLQKYSLCICSSHTNFLFPFFQKVQSSQNCAISLRGIQNISFEHWPNGYRWARSTNPHAKRCRLIILELQMKGFALQSAPGDIFNPKAWEWCQWRNINAWEFPLKTDWTAKPWRLRFRSRWILWITLIIRLQRKKTSLRWNSAIKKSKQNKNPSTDQLKS